jgi:DNA-binding response OmpR family regulator
MSKWSTARKKLPNLKMRRRILIADDDAHFARRFGEIMYDHGFEAKVVRTVSEAKNCVQFWNPEVVFVNFVLPETNAMSLVKFIQKNGYAKRTRVIVMSKQAMPQAVEHLRRAGVDNYLLKPFPLEDAINLAADRPTAAELDDKTDEIFPTEVEPTPQPAMVRELHLLNLLMKQAQSGESSTRLFNLLRMINLKIRGLRSSLIRCINADTAEVMASNDDMKMSGYLLQMRDYPEIAEVRRRKEPVVIMNARTDQIMQSVHGKLAQTPYVTIVLFPVFRFNQFYGVLSLRMQQKDTSDVVYIEKYGQVCSQIISMTIG